MEKCSVAHNALAAVGFARKQTQNSNNRRKVLSELKCPFTWDLSSLRKKNTHTLDSGSQASHYYGHGDSGCSQRAPRSQSSKALFYLHKITSGDRLNRLWEVEGPSECKQASHPRSRVGIFFSHTPLLWAWQVKWPGQWGRATESKTQFNWEVSLAPGQHIQKQTQWGTCHTQCTPTHPSSTHGLPSHLRICNSRDPQWANEYLAINLHMLPPSLCKWGAASSSWGCWSMARARPLQRLHSMYCRFTGNWGSCVQQG